MTPAETRAASGGVSRLYNSGGDAVKLLMLFRLRQKAEGALSAGIASSCENAWVARIAVLNSTVRNMVSVFAADFR